MFMLISLLFLKNEEDLIQSMVKLLTSSKSEVKRDIEVENIYGM